MKKIYIKPELTVTAICNNSIMAGSPGYGEGNGDTRNEENQFSKDNSGSFSIWGDEED